MPIRKLFYLSKSDRSALLVLLVVGAIAALTIYGIGGRHTATPDVAADSLPAVSKHPAAHHTDKVYQYDQGLPRAERFVFDPNTADSTQLLRLGLQPWQVQNIYRYRARGGVYRKPTDFARLYGLTAKQYRELEPYIRISDDYRPAAEVYAAPEERAVAPRDTLAFPVKIGPTERVALNLADTALLKRVPGIGSYFARRIVSYRQRLGGYCSTAQLEEIDDFPLEAIPYFEVDTAHIQKLNLNQLSLSQLKRHPYINYLQARDIVDYRRLKGPLRSLDDLRLLRDFPSETIERLRPYVTF